MTTRERVLPFVVGAGTAGGLVYLFDPIRGRARRALLRDQLTRLGREAADAADVAYRDARNRALGLAAEARRQLSGDGSRDGSDAAVAARARAEIGRVCSHPRAIEVEVRDSTLTLRGPVLASEADAVRAAARETRGVRVVHDELEVHETPDGVPSLQGEGRHPSRRRTPAERALVVAGAAVAVLPLVGRLVRSRRLLSLAPVLGAGVLVTLAASIARQEIEANRVAARRAAEAEAEREAEEQLRARAAVQGEGI